MTRKTKSGEPDKRRGGYRHGVPGRADGRISLPATPDLQERWRAASIDAGFHPTRGLAPFVVEAVEQYIKQRGLKTSR